MTRRDHELTLAAVTTTIPGSNSALALRRNHGVTHVKDLTPSAARVCDAAVGHFAEHGYDASSLNEIASLAGMRKASLYAHFASKDALFVQVFQRALVEETAYVESGFQQEMADNLPPGHWLALHLAERYLASPSLRFVLRTAFLPPVELKETITSGFEHYLETIRLGFCQALRERHCWADSDQSKLDTYGEAYLGIIDSLYVELMYADAVAYSRRAASLLKLLDDSLALAGRTLATAT